MIRIKLQLFGNLKRFLSGLGLDESGILEICDNMTIEELIKVLNIDLDETKVIMVNGRPRGLEYNLKQNDRLAIFPAIVGG